MSEQTEEVRDFAEAEERERREEVVIRAGWVELSVVRGRRSFFSFVKMLCKAVGRLDGWSKRKGKWVKEKTGERRGTLKLEPKDRNALLLFLSLFWKHLMIETNFYLAWLFLIQEKIPEREIRKGKERKRKEKERMT